MRGLEVQGTRSTGGSPWNLQHEQGRKFRPAPRKFQGTKNRNVLPTGFQKFMQIFHKIHQMGNICYGSRYGVAYGLDSRPRKHLLHQCLVYTEERKSRDLKNTFIHVGMTGRSTGEGAQPHRSRAQDEGRKVRGPEAHPKVIGVREAAHVWERGWGKVGIQMIPLPRPSPYWVYYAYTGSSGRDRKFWGPEVLGYIPKVSGFPER